MFGLQRWQVENTVKLIDDGNTIPFIARYRKQIMWDWLITDAISL